KETVGGDQPVAPGFARLRGHDLDAVATLQPVVQGHDAAVDLGPAAAVPDFGMHVVGEIQRRRAARQVDHFALGRERIDAVLDEFAVEFPEQARIAFGAGIEQAPHPFDLAVERRIAGGRAAGAARYAAGLLVAPVRGYAEFGLGVHLEGADLHFERLALGADHGRVQRAVVVVLGPGDVVVELAGQRRPQRVHDAEGGVAGGDVVDHHPYRAQVVELADGHALLLHLLPDAVDVLGPARHLGVQAVREQGLVEFALDLLDVAFSVAALAVEQAGDAAVGVGFQVAEREVLELPLELPDAEAVGQRRMDVAGELGQRAAFGLGQSGRMSQARQLPRQQDRHDPQVAHDRQQQPAQALAARAVRAALGMQGPDLVGRTL